MKGSWVKDKKEFTKQYEKNQEAIKNIFKGINIDDEDEGESIYDFTGEV